MGMNRPGISYISQHIFSQIIQNTWWLMMFSSWSLSHPLLICQVAVAWLHLQEMQVLKAHNV
jgi:hypothetical protein